MEQNETVPAAAHWKSDWLVRVYGLLMFGAGAGLAFFTSRFLSWSGWSGEAIVVPGVLGTAMVVYGPWRMVCGSLEDSHGEFVPWKYKVNKWFLGLAVFAGFSFAGVWAWCDEFDLSWGQALLPGMLSTGAVLGLLWVVWIKNTAK